jgi:hypothetical protein
MTPPVAFTRSTAVNSREIARELSGSFESRSSWYSARSPIGSDRSSCSSWDIRDEREMREMRTHRRRQCRDLETYEEDYYEPVY